MKKLALMGLMVFCASSAFSAVDPWGSPRETAWRSSFTCVVESHVLFSTRAVHVYSVRVASATSIPSLGVSGTFAMFNTTIPPTAANYVSKSSGAYTLTGITQGSPSLTRPADVVSSIFQAGATVQKSDTSCVEILWDFVPATFDQFVPWRP